LTPSPPPIDMDLSPDWEYPDPPALGDGDDEYEEQILDTLITGEGHSSWGSFKLRGRIRAWDGMIILVKDYVRHKAFFIFFLRPLFSLCRTVPAPKAAADGCTRDTSFRVVTGSDDGEIPLHRCV
jgi:hypothetical protein